MPSSRSLSAMLQSTGISWRGAFTRIWCPGFYNMSGVQGTALDHLALVAKGLAFLDPTVTTGERVHGRLPP